VYIYKGIYLLNAVSSILRLSEQVNNINISKKWNQEAIQQEEEGRLVLRFLDMQKTKRRKSYV